MGEDQHEIVIRRVLVVVILFGAVALIPWWVSMFLWLVFVIFYKNPYEAIFAGFLFDTLYAVPLDLLFFPGTILGALCVTVMICIRPRVAFFSE